MSSWFVNSFVRLFLFDTLFLKCCLLAHIEMYHVYVDGFLRTTVRAYDKTKALVEGVDGARVSFSEGWIILQIVAQKHLF